MMTMYGHLCLGRRGSTFVVVSSQQVNLEDLSGEFNMIENLYVRYQPKTGSSVVDQHGSKSQIPNPRQGHDSRITYQKRIIVRQRELISRPDVMGEDGTTVNCHRSSEQANYGSSLRN